MKKIGSPKLQKARNSYRAQKIWYFRSKWYDFKIFAINQWKSTNYLRSYWWSPRAIDRFKHPCRTCQLYNTAKAPLQKSGTIENNLKLENRVTPNNIEKNFNKYRTMETTTNYAEEATQDLPSAMKHERTTRIMPEDTRNRHHAYSKGLLDRRTRSIQGKNIGFRETFLSLIVSMIPAVAFCVSPWYLFFTRETCSNY